MFRLIAISFLVSTITACSVLGQSITLEKVFTVGGGEDESFFQVSDVVVDGTGNIYIADRQAFSISKYDSTGRYVSQIGRRGDGPGEFSGEPYLIALLDSTLLVFQIGAGRGTQVLTLDLEYSATRLFPSPLAVTGSNRNTLLIGSPLVGLPPYGDNSDAYIAEYNIEGDLLRTIILDELSPYSIENMLDVFADSRGYVILVFKFVNRVDVRDETGALVNRFSISEMPEKYPGETLKVQIEGIPAYAPGGILFASAALDDKNHIFIQGGQLNGEPANRNVFVVDYSGNVITSFMLPEGSRLMYIDEDEYLYARSNNRSQLDKYRIVFDGY